MYRERIRSIESGWKVQMYRQQINWSDYSRLLTGAYILLLLGIAIRDEHQSEKFRNAVVGIEKGTSDKVARVRALHDKKTRR